LLTGALHDADPARPVVIPKRQITFSRLSYKAMASWPFAVGAMITPPQTATDANRLVDKLEKVLILPLWYDDRPAGSAS